MWRVFVVQYTLYYSVLCKGCDYVPDIVIVALKAAFCYIMHGTYKKAVYDIVFLHVSKVIMCFLYNRFKLLWFIV